MEHTTNYNLIKPHEDDFYNVDDFNINADIIDSELKKVNVRLTEKTDKSDTNNLKREVANLKLYQDATERIENGIVFGDNFIGEPMNMTFDEENTQGVRDEGFGLFLRQDVKKDVLDNSIASQCFVNSGTGSRTISIFQDRRRINITLGTTETTTILGWGFNDPIDMTDVDAIEITWRNDSSATGNNFVWAYFLTANAFSGDQNSFTRRIVKQNRFAEITETLDVSALSGMQYIKVFAEARTNTSWGSNSDIRVFSIVLKTKGGDSVDLVYRLDESDGAVVFVTKEGDFDMDAYINGEMANKSISGGEYQFDIGLPMKSPIELKLVASRNTKQSSDRITRILGGIAR